MIIVTGGAGFIGSNLVRVLNERGRTDIVVVDDLSDGTKFLNLLHCQIQDYLDKDAFREGIQAPHWGQSVEAVFHQGACSVTTEWDGKYMMDNNYTYSKELFHACQKARIPFIYASSAAVYGLSHTSDVGVSENEKPLNVYGYSKLLFDNYIQPFLLRKKITAPVVGLRYFNVYGMHEQHKGNMASTIFHFNQQLKDRGVVKLFAGSDGYADGEQRRDFVFVEDVVSANLWFLAQWEKTRDLAKFSGIYNLGTGVDRSFNEVAQAVINWHGGGRIEYIPFPEHLKGRYQSFTRADMQSLVEKLGYTQPFMMLEDGVNRYLDWLNTPQS